MSNIFEALLYALLWAAAGVTLVTLAVTVRDQLVWVVLVLGLGGALAGCSFYHRPLKVAVDQDPAYDLHVVQADDFGSFWNVAAPTEALAAVERARTAGNVIVVLFIHGWHHNAQSGNLDSFKATLTKLRARLDSDAYRASRIELTEKHAEVSLIGIYVAWRGKSLPMPLDFLTMWGRKSAAERVGNGDVREFLLRLQQQYAAANASKSGPFMGLVTIGHSFGGQVLLRTTAEYLEHQLIDATASLADPFGVTPARARDTNGVVIDGFGDLCVLVNPATEAYQFARIDRLYRGLTYHWAQTPQLVVFSAENDKARRVLFPVARGFAQPLRPSFRSPAQGDLFGRALGEYAPQRTHTLKRAARDAKESLVDTDYSQDRAKVLAKDFMAETTFAGATLAPIGTPIPYSPIAVVYTEPALINGHSDIFKDEFVAFLADYVAYIEGKRLLLRPLRGAAESAAAPR